MSAVLDASAVLALFYSEPGAERVSAAVPGSCLSAVNLAEVVSVMLDRGVTGRVARRAVGSIGLDVVAFDSELAFRAAELRAPTRALGLSLGDRACLALAGRLEWPALTADRSWLDLELGISIESIR